MVGHTDRREWVSTRREQSVNEHLPETGRSDEGQPPRRPRWVSGLLVALLLVAVLLVVAMLLVGGDHGPGRHG